MNSYKFAVISLIGMALACPVITHAAEPQFRGYFSQGIIYSDDNPFFDDDTGTNFNYRELGLNVSWDVGNRIRFAGQALSRKAGVLEDGDPRIDFLLMDYNFYASEEISAGIRLGRVKNHYGLYNTTRDVPHGRPGVFVPQSVYFESVRAALLSSDGGNLYTTLTNDFADISLDVYGGRAHFETESIEHALFQSDIPGEFEDIDGGGLKAAIEPKAIPGLTAAFTYLAFNTEYEDAPSFSQAEFIPAQITLALNPSRYAEFITNLEIDATMNLYSLQYAWSDWIVSTEYMGVELEFNEAELLHLPFSLPRSRIEVVGYYLQAEWLASSHLSVYTRYEEIFYDKNDKNGEDYAALTGGNAATQYSKTSTLGARWYFTPDFSVTAEYSNNKGAAFLNGQADVNYATLKEHWDLFIVQMSFHF